MKLFKFQFPAYIAGDRPHWSRSWFAADEAAFRADIERMFTSAVIVLAVRECTPFERAEHAVSVHNERHVSCVYGQSSLQMLAGIFGENSAEVYTYGAFQIEENKRETAYLERQQRESEAAMERSYSSRSERHYSNE